MAPHYVTRLYEYMDGLTRCLGINCYASDSRVFLRFNLGASFGLNKQNKRSGIRYIHDSSYRPFNVVPLRP